MDWDKLRIFHAVAEAGSFTHAGDTLNLSQSAVSRQIGALEDTLKVPLFHRHARGLKLTEQGDLLYRTVHDVFAKLAMTEAIIKDSREKPSGDLRVTATVAFGTTWLTPRMREFLDLYPEIQVHLLLDDRELDLSMREADVAIRMRAPIQPDLIQRKLFTVHYHIYAAPSYLQRKGTPQTVADLDKHDILTYGEGAPPTIREVNWLAGLGRAPGDARKSLLTVNNIYGVQLAVQSGLGLAALPDYMARGNPALVQVLPELEGPSFDTHFVYPEELRESKRISVFRDFILRRVRDWTY